MTALTKAASAGVAVTGLADDAAAQRFRHGGERLPARLERRGLEGAAEEIEQADLRLAAQRRVEAAAVERGDRVREFQYPCGHALLRSDAVADLDAGPIPR